MKCAKCGTTIKNVYYVDGKPYGIECFKMMMGFKREREAVEYAKREENRKADLQAKRDLKRSQELENNIPYATAVYEMLVAKNMKNIKNEYKINLRNEVIEEFETFGSLDNYTLSLVNRNLFTTNKDERTYRNVVIELLNDEKLIENMLSYFTYNEDDEEFIQNLEIKLDQFKNVYGFEIEVTNGVRVTRVNDIMVRQEDIEE